MKFCITVPTLIAFVLIALPLAAQTTKGDDIRDRITIQEKLIYEYAYTYDASDCETWSTLFTTDAVLDLGENRKIRGRDALRQACIARRKNVVGEIKSHHYMTNTIFDKLTHDRAETRSYGIVTWQKPGEQTISVISA